MVRFAAIPAFILSILLALPVAAIDTGGGGTGGGGTGGGGTGGGGTGGGDTAHRSSPSTHRSVFTPLDQARGAVNEQLFEVALLRLQRIVKNEPQNADAWNLLGFTYRMLGELDQSGSAYLQVLAIDPNHTGALEYQGELFITQGNIAAAKANLARLQELCDNCEELEDLELALQQAGA